MFSHVEDHALSIVHVRGRCRKLVRTIVMQLYFIHILSHTCVPSIAQSNISNSQKLLQTCVRENIVFIFSVFSFWHIVTHIWVVDPPTTLKSTKILVQIYKHFYL